MEFYELWVYYGDCDGINPIKRAYFSTREKAEEAAAQIENAYMDDGFYCGIYTKPVKDYIKFKDIEIGRESE